MNTYTAAENGVVFVVLLMIITARITSGQPEIDSCKDFELISCGGLDQSWTVCYPRASNVIRILSARLDVRYETRNCRRYGTPMNFGLAINGRGLWTVNGCFGSFLLCLEKGPSEADNNTNIDNNQSSEVNSIHGNYFQNKDATATMPNFSQIHHNNHNEDDDYDGDDDDDDDDDDEKANGDYQEDSNGDNVDDDDDGVDNNNINYGNGGFYHNDEDGDDGVYSDTGRVHDNDNYGTTTVATVDIGKDRVTVHKVINDTNNSQVTEENILTDELMKEKGFAVKYVLMGGIITGGVIIVILICVITYLCTCNDSYEEASKKDAAKNKGHKNKYFRQKKWSIAPLVPDYSRSESVTSSSTSSAPISTIDDYKDVYDCIPADMTRSNNNTIIKRETRTQTAHVLRILDETDDSKKSHDYFVLIPESINIASNSDTTVKINNADDNEYDHLVHGPIRLIPDASIYNHIEIQPETQNKTVKTNSEKLETEIV